MVGCARDLSSRLVLSVTSWKVRDRYQEVSSACPSLVLGGFKTKFIPVYLFFFFEHLPCTVPDCYDSYYLFVILKAHERTEEHGHSQRLILPFNITIAARP